MAVDNGYNTFAEVQSFFKGAPITSIMSQSEIEELIDKFGLKVEQLSGLSWRAKSVTEELTTLTRNVQNGPYFNMYAIHLKHPRVRSVTSLQIFNGSDYEEWIGTKTEGRGDDYFIDYKNGIIYTIGYRWIWRGLDVKTTYTYGDTEVDTDAWELNLRYVARHLMSMPNFYKVIPESKTGKEKTARDENNEAIRELEYRLAATFQVMPEGDWV